MSNEDNDEPIPEVSQLWLIADVTLEVKTATGRVYTYKPSEHIRRVQAEHTDVQIEALVDECMKEKLKFCKWDREHPGAVHDSEKGIRAIMKDKFLLRRRYLRQSEKAKQV